MVGTSSRASTPTSCPSETTAARASRASSTEMPKLPVMVSRGIGAQNSALRSATGSSPSVLTSSVTMLRIQPSSHQIALPGTNDGCTSLR